ncbi:ribonuclease H [Gemmatimonas sp.]|uniref:ribonuclease H family protein n=1 Tax=Gemmatimonas sp. TaxID=1962908 RepID=UPI0033410E40
MSARYPLVAVYADESCLGNGKSGATPGGLGALIEFRKPDGALSRFDLWASEPDTTNNRMALRSVIDSYMAMSRKGNRLSVQFTTDSRYIVDGMTSWVKGWMARGWRRKDGAVENVELWQEAVDAIVLHETQWCWVKGHAGHPQNEYANHLATRAAAMQDSSDGLVPSAFEEWMAAQGPKTRSQPLSPFPVAERFVPAASLPSTSAVRL